MVQDEGGWGLAVGHGLTTVLELIAVSIETQGVGVQETNRQAQPYPAQP